MVLGLLLLAASVEAQDSRRTSASPGSSQLSSLAAFLVPTVAGVSLILPDEASDGAVNTGRVLFFAGTIIGPAVGYWRGGASGRGWLGAGIRGGLMVLMLASDDASSSYVGVGDAAVGVMAVVGLAIYDVIRVPSVVAKSQAQLALAPGWVSGSGIGVRVAW